MRGAESDAQVGRADLVGVGFQSLTLFQKELRRTVDTMPRLPELARVERIEDFANPATVRATKLVCL